MELCDTTLERYLKGCDSHRVEGLMDWASIRKEGTVVEKAYCILRQIVNGLVFIHSLHEVHRDLNPPNGMYRHFLQDSLLLVLYKEGRWKIADFGLAAEATSKGLITSKSARGKPGYRPPELTSGTEWHYNNKVDIWSAGCIAYELFAGRKAFRDDDMASQYSNDDIAVPLDEGYYSAQSKEDIIRNITLMLRRDPMARPSALELRERISHVCEFCEDTSRNSYNSENSLQCAFIILICC
jgi:eukaryotic-like serine/threonine-protein kinase